MHGLLIQVFLLLRCSSCRNIFNNINTAGGELITISKIVEDISVNDINRIVEALKVTTCPDFSNYAFSSFRRRIIRFTQIKRIRDVEALIGNITKVDGFADNFIEEITVNVTEMFRDPSFWSTLRDIVLPLLSAKPAIKIWHAACSTGEEVFSMTILLNEAGLLDKTEICCHRSEQ